MKWLLAVFISLSVAGMSMAAGPPPVDDGHRVVLITGSTGGLGREVARALAAMGDHVIIHGRDSGRGEALAQEINEEGAGSARFYRADFASLDDVRLLASEITRDYGRLDVIVNNAGIALIKDPVRRLSKDGYELHFQVNYLSGFLLTELLLPLLEKSPAPRIVNVSSGSADPLDFDNLMLATGYSAWRAYGQSKLAQVMYTIELADRLSAKNIVANALHPATFMDTGMVLEAGITPESSVMDGRDAVLQLVVGDNVGNGLFYNGLEPSSAHKQAYDPAVRAQLWEVSQQLTAIAAPVL
ncbi:MAG: SDR family NAD(P)-dependent oxidoreductase [Halieaceae bacterium]|jgi:NAD(P)-dependent dehydrogenase (short-subunit alcohol dehydrogenase family)|nr:SDR family NAD(P)-dependent oxidoreductase [Halieaceae bacterium]